MYKMQTVYIYMLHGHIHITNYTLYMQDACYMHCNNTESTPLFVVALGSDLLPVID